MSRPLIKPQSFQWETNPNLHKKSFRTTIFTNPLQSAIKTNPHFKINPKLFLALQIAEISPRLKEPLHQIIIFPKINPLLNL
jgi:hypothetical protein